jgi:2-keto-4-pentenoate hydratase
MPIEESAVPTDLDPTVRTATLQVLWGLAHGQLIEGEPPTELTAYQDSDPSTGEALQLSVLDMWQDAGEDLGGWKVGFTSRKMRDSMGQGYRPFGYVLASRIFTSGTRVPDGIPNCKLEPEIAVVMGERLGGPDVTVEQARAAVAAVAPAFEINSSRLPPGMPKAIRLGNSLNNWGIVVGPERSVDIDLSSVSVELYADGELIGSAGAGPEIIDDPYLSLTRVCRTLAASGRYLEAGQRVITGSLLAATPVAGRTRFEARYGALGDVSVTFA